MNRALTIGGEEVISSSNDGVSGPMNDSNQSNEWRYSGLVFALLIFAGAACLWVLQTAQTDPSPGGGGPIHHTAVSIFSLIAGLLFLAGAFGIWAIRTTAAIEGPRRVGQLVDDMDYLQDGILVIEHGRGVVGMNSAARALATFDEGGGDDLQDVFPSLTDKDVSALLDPVDACEIERVSRSGHALYSLRFRSQPAHDMSLILVSDVTAARSRQMRDRQIGHFQLIGRMARGVAHDFNNVLCSISAHAALLDRPGKLSEDESRAAKTIVEQADRGSSLARRLISLTEVDTTGRPTDQLPHHVENAAELLRVVLSPLWDVQPISEGTYPAVPLDGSQIEQMIVNLGLHAADEIETPGQLRIELRPGTWGRDGAEEAIVEITAHPPGVPAQPLAEAKTVEIEDAGVIESVVRSVVEGVGGAVHILAFHDGHHAYQMMIPALMTAHNRTTAQTGMSDELCKRMSGWQVLLARPREADASGLEQRLLALGLNVEFATDLVVVLGRMETDFPFEAVVVDRRLLGDTAEALIKAMVKLKPDVGLVVLCAAPELEPDDLAEDVVFVQLEATPDTVLRAVSTSAEMAAARSGAVAVG